MLDQEFPNGRFRDIGDETNSDPESKWLWLHSATLETDWVFFLRIDGASRLPIPNFSRSKQEVLLCECLPRKLNKIVYV